MAPAPVSGTFPFLVSTLNDAAVLRSVQEAVAASCARYLREAGYFADQEEEPLLEAYRERLNSEAPSRGLPLDFIACTAEARAKEHSASLEDEIRRMQKVLKLRLADRIHGWTFGNLPGRANSLYEHCASARACCAQLVCPAVLATDSVVHVASINPVAVHAASKWITHELAVQAGTGESPFVFPFMVEFPVWMTLVERHFS